MPPPTFTSPVYAAGEDPVEGVSSSDLAAGMVSRGHRDVSTVEDQKELSCKLADTIDAGDIIVCLGAGDITKWAAELPSQIERERSA